MEDEDCALLDGQAPERAVERVALVDPEEPIRTRRPVDRQDTDVGRPRAPTPGLGVARVDEQAPDPGFEAVRVTQVRQLAPDGDEGDLQGVLGEHAVSQNPAGEHVHSVAGQADQCRECIAIATLGPLDKISHRLSLWTLSQ